MNTLILLSLAFGILFLMIGINDKIKENTVALTIRRLAKEGKFFSDTKVHSAANVMFGRLVKTSLILICIGIICLSYKLIK